MADDTAFRIQLGLILPKLNESLTESLNGIANEVIDYLLAGTLPDQEAVNAADVKDILLQNLEILINTQVLPNIEQRLTPDVEEDSDAEEGNEATGDAGE